jgi:YHS domain-containing protein
MSWRELEGKRIEQVRTVDQQEVVLQLEGGELVQIRAEAPAATSETSAELRVEIQKATPPPGPAGAGGAAAEEAGLVRDPVCHMMIEPAHAAATSEYKGSTYHFCAVGCKAEFDRDPDHYVGEAAAGPA